MLFWIPVFTGMTFWFVQKVSALARTGTTQSKNDFPLSCQVTLPELLTRQAGGGTKWVRLYRESNIIMTDVGLTSFNVGKSETVRQLCP
jgi:hypothetical protein